jgi:hypothetical protein
MPVDLNGDGRTDTIYWIPAENAWEAMFTNSKGTDFTSHTAQAFTGASGSDGTILTCDLDGDGKTDIFMWRKTDHVWTVNLSKNISSGSDFHALEWPGVAGAVGPAMVLRSCEGGDLDGGGHRRRRTRHGRHSILRSLSSGPGGA